MYIKSGHNSTGMPVQLIIAIKSLLVRVGIVLLSVSINITRLISHPVSVSFCNPHIYQHRDQANHYVHEVEVESTAGIHVNTPIVVGQHQESSKHLIESSDGVECAYEQSLHRVRTLGTDELKHTGAD